MLLQRQILKHDRDVNQPTNGYQPLIAAVVGSRLPILSASRDIRGNTPTSMITKPTIGSSGSFQGEESRGHSSNDLVTRNRVIIRAQMLQFSCLSRCAKFGQSGPLVEGISTVFKFRLWNLVSRMIGLPPCWRLTTCMNSDGPVHR